MKHTLSVIAVLIFTSSVGFPQTNLKDTASVYKKRVLETTEIDFLTGFYIQDGDNAAVSGGIGTEELTDVSATFIIYIPLNDDDILSIDAGISAYTSASSSNIDPFDDQFGDPFVASSGHRPAMFGQTLPDHTAIAQTIEITFGRHTSPYPMNMTTLHLDSVPAIPDGSIEKTPNSMSMPICSQITGAPTTQ
jgi:hypothetical protein